jgi:hypothetical protein
MIGSIINKKQHAYGHDHEYELWKEFEVEMLKNDLSQSLEKGHTSHERQADLVYVVGARICERYYNQAQDKSKAIREIIRMKNNKKFLERSGYAGGLN